jgi:hypothetical protein
MHKSRTINEKKALDRLLVEEREFQAAHKSRMELRKKDIANECEKDRQAIKNENMGCIKTQADIISKKMEREMIGKEYFSNELVDDTLIIAK